MVCSGAREVGQHVRGIRKDKQRKGRATIRYQRALKIMLTLYSVRTTVRAFAVHSESIYRRADVQEWTILISSKVFFFELQASHFLIIKVISCIPI